MVRYLVPNHLRIYELREHFAHLVTIETGRWRRAIVANHIFANSAQVLQYLHCSWSELFNRGFGNLISMLVSGGLSYTKQSLITTGVFQASAFGAPCLGCTGNLGRNTYSNPGYANTDLSMQKIFTTPWFTGDKTSHLQIRVDAFNSFNRVNLGGIQGDISNANFGKVTSAGAARTFQVGAKFRF
jgi:hypothetical protein